ncbi:MAG: Hpt domain-containing protein [Desulfuromonadales bacterium]|nr:MAG: Hpt domain-containing protein [Desulfuromonadales bacterium]
MKSVTTKSVRVRVDPEIIDIVPTFLDHRWQDVASLQDALAHEDSSLIKKIAHNLKGAGRSFGFDAVSIIGERLEKAASGRKWSTVERIINRLISYLERVEPVCE